MAQLRCLCALCFLHSSPNHSAFNSRTLLIHVQISFGSPIPRFHPSLALLPAERVLAQELQVRGNPDDAFYACYLRSLIRLFRPQSRNRPPQLVWCEKISSGFNLRLSLTSILPFGSLCLLEGLLESRKTY